MVDGRIEYSTDQGHRMYQAEVDFENELSKTYFVLRVGGRLKPLFVHSYQRIEEGRELGGGLRLTVA